MLIPRPSAVPKFLILLTSLSLRLKGGWGFVRQGVAVTGISSPFQLASLSAGTHLNPSIFNRF